jgi:hypothetical protein
MPERPALANGEPVASVDPMQARIDAAAFTLLREGRNPTVSLVRERMGGASPNVVAPALQRWRQTFAAQLDANAGSALEVLPPGIIELVQALWSRALFEAHRVRADAPSATQAIDRLNSAILDLRDQAARLQAREDQMDAQLRDLDAQRRRLVEAEAALARRLNAKPRPRAPPLPRPRNPTAGAASPKRGATKKKKPGKPGMKRRPKPAAARRPSQRRRPRT